MAMLSRALLAGPVLPWTLLAIGLAEDRSPASRGDAILGGGVITFIPVVLGTVLERSCWAQKRKAQAVAARRPDGVLRPPGGQRSLDRIGAGGVQLE